ncbi:MAG: GMC family oxidoreductase, partial [Polyangiaceae bacterium]|nr:GMC family oxidoreductase [Polyangiaceae bacterium]
HGRTLTRDLEDSCDVVVIGSGAGGSVVAATLAEAGRRVIVLEEGAYYAKDDYQRFAPSESVRRMFRDAGMVMAFGVGQTPMISITMGRAVGGSSLLTGGVCFRVPSEVHHRWERELGLSQYSEKAFEEAYAEVERRLDVTEVPKEMRSESTRRYVDAAEKLGIPMQPLRRNTGNECEGNARCNFTCPKGAKRSVDVSYLPSATERGTVILSDALATDLIVKNGRAAGVEGRLLGGPFGAPGASFKIHAPVVVAACGTLHTPLLLMKRGIGKASRVVGRNVTLHPAVRIVARFDDPVRGWDGALQSVYSDHFAEEGIKLVGVYTAVNFLAAGLPGVGPKLRERARALSHCAVFGAMIHDDGGGAVRSGPGREPILTYDMVPRDLARLRRAITILAELSIAAGAREVYTSAWGVPPLKTMDDARRLEAMKIDARRIECMAFHPLGSARVGLDARSGVVDQRGETFDLPGLFIADGSVLPTSIGVNSQQPIMATATRIAWQIDERFGTLASAR